MNWTGGTRRRIHKTSDRKKQQLYFEKKRSLRNTQTDTPENAKIFGMSQDLLFLQTASKVFSKERKIKPVQGEGEFEGNFEKSAPPVICRPNVINLSPKENSPVRSKNNIISPVPNIPRKKALVLSPQTLPKYLRQKKMTRVSPIYQTNLTRVSPQSKDLSRNNCSDERIPTPVDGNIKTQRSFSINMDNRATLKSSTIAQEKDFEFRVNFPSTNPERSVSQSILAEHYNPDDNHVSPPSVARAQPTKSEENKENSNSENSAKTQKEISHDEMLFRSLFKGGL